MAEATICPLVLLSTDNIPVSQINKNFAGVAKSIIDECKKYKIKLELSREVWDRINSLFPWNHEGNDVLMQYIHHWRAAILGPLNKMVIFVDVDQGVNQQKLDEITCEVSNDNDLHIAWVKWLCFWSTGNMINNEFIKGLATEGSCCPQDNHSPLCERFTMVLEIRDWKTVRFPLYKKYPSSLPAEGQYTFRPPDNWNNQQISRGQNHGYLDKDGNEWVRDKLHQDHWDVQIFGTTYYRRISDDGRDIDF